MSCVTNSMPVVIWKALSFNHSKSQSDSPLCYFPPILWLYKALILKAPQGLTLIWFMFDKKKLSFLWGRTLRPFQFPGFVSHLWLSCLLIWQNKRMSIFWLFTPLYKMVWETLNKARTWSAIHHSHFMVMIFLEYVFFRYFPIV